MNKFVTVIILLLYCSFIFWLSSKPSLPTPFLFIHQDKIFHMVAYFFMGILAWLLFSQCFAKQSIVIIVSISYCSLYGISDEWHQSFVPGRDADSMDWLADTLGASISLIAVYLKKMKCITETQAG